MTHKELKELYGNRDILAKENPDEYVPIDFEAYSILDVKTRDSIDKDKPAEGEKALKDKPIEVDEKVWRISSLTTYVDEDTKILLLPLPESKRKTKLEETIYGHKVYSDIIMSGENVFEKLTERKSVRFEDKTKEEIKEDIKRKRKKQYGRLVKLRTRQLMFVGFLFFFYIFVYRRFAPKSIMNSAIYHQTV